MFAKDLSCWVWVLMCRGGTDDYLQVAYLRYLYLFELSAVLQGTRRRRHLV